MVQVKNAHHRLLACASADSQLPATLSEKSRSGGMTKLTSRNCELKATDEGEL